MTARLHASSGTTSHPSLTLVRIYPNQATGVYEFRPGYGASAYNLFAATGWLAAGLRGHSFRVLPLLVVSFGRSASPPQTTADLKSDQEN